MKKKQLATTAKEKESVRKKLVVTAEKLRLKAKQLAVTAKEKETIRIKLEATARDLARAKATDEAMLESIGDLLLHVHVLRLIVAQNLVRRHVSLRAQSLNANQHAQNHPAQNQSASQSVAHPLAHNLALPRKYAQILAQILAAHPGQYLF